jgi:hypothetical protein
MTEKPKAEQEIKRERREREPLPYAATLLRFHCICGAELVPSTIGRVECACGRAWEPVQSPGAHG